jgi:glycine/D-amino acid oxidase-like deaminating enzyme/nitrite reductase/ring-hydroxylating ferredoxin subunit
MATIPRMSQSHWTQSAPAPRRAVLDTDIRADVVVAGAGMAGVSTAWELTRLGLSVVLLDAGQLGGGVTGHSTAKLTVLHTLIHSHLRDAFGPEAARLYAASQADAVEHVVATAAELGIECEIERRPAYVYAAGPDHDDAIAAEADAAREAGVAARFEPDPGLPFATGAGVRVDDQVQFHPRRYLLGLADDLVRHGGRIFERTRVTGLREGHPAMLTTSSGHTVTAADVVLATHYPIFDRSLAFTRLKPQREAVIAAPVDADRAPYGMYLTPDEGTRSVRGAPLPDGRRLLVVAGEKFTPGEPGVVARFGRLAAWARERFGVTEITHHWATQDNWTTDRMPYVGPFHPATGHVFVATGFCGWGLSGGAMAGRLLADQIRGEKVEWSDLYDPRRVHPVTEAGAFARANLSSARHFVADRLHAARDTEGVAAIEPGGGAVVRLQGRPCAVHRDDDGALHAVSAVCTHLGCLVAYNDAERTWDCPCHGSRFGLGGAILHGPATTPLERRDPGPG